ncbi:calcium-binding protein [Microvirga aerophila]|uniref:Peptidase M10 serralysin C-terminal domain-containing protein n=1 Tax=Microvirga aerophila TaxID=670291 RepID=A0A512BMX3_9HYPH|nr:calcium-binding protein [Microvirga aerophila]GEO13308.1 hypothetical protein MAE02_10040 [Microvirga aerophila]
MTLYILNPANGSAIGTEGDDIFSTPISSPYFYESDWSRFALRGGGGTDTLNLNYRDTYDLRKFAEFSGVEIISFSDHGADLYLSAQHLASITQISGPSGFAEGRIYFTGNAGHAFDLRGKAFSGNYKLMNPTSGYADIIISDKSQLLADNGAHLNFSTQSGARVRLVGGTFTDAEEQLLLRKGFNFTWDDNDNGAGNAAPVISGLHGDKVATSGLSVVALDIGANASISDDKAVRKITVSVVGSNANDFVTLSRNAFDLPDGVKDGGRIRGLETFNEKVFANFANVTNSSFEIYFNGEATAAKINKLVQSLVYYNDSTGGQTTRQVSITAWDGADKAATSTVTITHSGNMTSPVTGGQTDGTANADTIKGSAKADVIYGGAGNDTIYGGAGKDTLRGDAGKEMFVFDTRPSKSNVDTIKSYKIADDSIWLDNNVFTKVGRGTSEDPKKLAGKAFWTGDKAHDADDRIIYNKKTGALYYDQDGTGSKAAVQFAKIDKGLKMTASELFVV